MADTIINCPNCGHAIPLTDALTGQIRHDIEARLKQDEDKHIKAAGAAAEAQLRDQTGQDLKSLKEQLEDQRNRTQAAQKAELTLRKEKSALRLPRKHPHSGCWTAARPGYAVLPNPIRP